jgi:4-amino-4-deoxy-L-arabinose transferase-like glycosyltransferase
VLWAIYQTLALADLVLVCVVLLTMMAVHSYAAGGRAAGFVLGMLTGMALLVGGPVALVYLLPAMLLAPMWSDGNRKTGWGSWYGAIALATVIGIGLWLAWLIPAAAATGMGWQQAVAAASTLQPLELFYNKGGWWWYLYLIPLAFFPWSVWPLGWMRLWQVRSQKSDSGFTLCLVWGVAAVVLLAMLPVRQPQYLLPLFPAYVLAFAWLLMHEDLRTVGEDGFFAGMTFPVIAIGGALAVLPGLPQVEFLPAFLWQISPLVGVAVAAVGIALSWAPTMNTGNRVVSIAVTTMFVVVAGSFFIGYQWGDRFQTKALNQLLYEAENQGRAIAQVAAYQGEFHFDARLTQPIYVLSREQTRNWILENPTSLMITYAGGWQPNAIGDSAKLLELPYGDSTLQVWDAGLLIPSP